MDSEQETPQDSPPAGPHNGSTRDQNTYRDFPMVGVGASAGGLEALRQLFSDLPDKTGMAFVVVQHLDPHHESQLAPLLAKSSRMPVLDATDGLEVRPDHVYVIPPNSNLAVGHGRLIVMPRGEFPGPHLPVDYLFRSLAVDRSERSIAVVLSGTGSDGTLGLCEIKSVGGITFAQQEATATHAGMPHSAIESGCVDFVLPPDQIARRLAEIGGHPYLVSKSDMDGSADAEKNYKRILKSVHNITGVDFSHYRDTTIRRRIMRRMALHANQSLQNYADRLELEPREVEALYRDLLINVTSFFRDPEMFETLKHEVYPAILKTKSTSTPVRIWVPGCSTGQEAYSLAMSLLEFLDDKPLRPPIQIFATDLSDPESLEKARAGIYPDGIESELSPERLRRFFKKEDHRYRIDKTIRDMCVFARQNLLADPPFSHVDLVSCRNVLIYMSATLQQRIIPIFHFSLNFPGYLALGTAETVGDFGDLFDLVDRPHKIYAKKAAGLRPAFKFPVEDFKRSLSSLGHPRSFPTAVATDFQREADRVALGEYAPAAVLVNDNFDVLQFRGRTAPYLESPPGEPTTKLLKMAREGLFLDLRTALDEAKTSNEPVTRENVWCQSEGDKRQITLRILPVRPPHGSESCFLVVFEETRAAADKSRDTSTPGNQHSALGGIRAALAKTLGLQTKDASDQRPSDPAADQQPEIVRLRNELAATKDYMQSLVEQQDASNEELRSANEEILSSNEELQSTNEELETAKEELQSANEELTTVNEQLHRQNIEINQANNDLMNIFSSTGIAIVIVGTDLRIRRITPPAQATLKLRPTDVGRPIGDLKLNIELPNIESLLLQTIETVQPQHLECRNRDGRWFILQFHPYRTADRRIDGAVMFLVDIDDIKRNEIEIRDANRRKDEFLAMLAHELRNPLAAVKNAVEIMRLAGEDLQKAVEPRHILERQVDQMVRLVNDLLDMSRIVEGKLEIRLERVALADLVMAAMDSTRSQIENGRHRVSVSLPEEQTFLFVDRNRMVQVLTNLLNNAAKFTQPEGEISLWAERIVAEPYGHDMVAIHVRDNGCGIGREFLPHIFEMFTQGHVTIDRRRGGLGVGLTLVKTLVELHRGTVEARSDGPGHGTEFIVRLPAHVGGSTETPAQHTPNDATTAASTRKVLVVDDNRDAAHSLASLLRMLGHEAHTAFDGPEAVTAIESIKPDIALVDIGLPGLNGHEVAKKIREQPGLDTVRLIALSGYAQEEDRRRSKEAGFDAHVAKPIAIEELASLVAR